MNRDGETKADNAPGNYYVSVKDGRRLGLLLGPFRNDHAKALVMVGAVKRKALDLDPWGAFYAYGTVRMSESYAEPGTLNQFFYPDSTDHQDA